MTDKEIIKALECCISPECENCPYDGDDLLRPCNHNLMKDALDLINRQKAEIEKLSNCVVMQEKLLKENENRMESVVKNITADKKLKAEAIKEFAERFRKKANMFAIARTNPTKPMGYEMDMEYRISKSHFDNLVKEHEKE